MRKGIEINSVEDFKGLTLASRRAGPGDTIYFREFLEDVGLKSEDLNIIEAYGDDSKNWLAEKKEDKVNILHQINEGDLRGWLIEGKIDGGLYHLTSVRKVAHEGYLYRPMDWMDSAISHAVLVFNQDYVKNHPEEVQKVVDAYAKIIKYEKDLPESEKDKSWDKGLFMASTFQGLQVPQYDFPPKVRMDLLNEVQDLLIKYGYIDEKIDIGDFVDNSFVEAVHKELESR
jgi:NitT/TauT family transport system substrate-binding protein